jgi:hypothetical protein
MDTATQKTDAQLIQENTDYVLGMYDLYQNDDEIAAALYLKGLPSYIVARVLHNIKLPAYQKRVRQGKRLLLSGAIIVATMLLIEFLLRRLPGADTLMASSGRDEAEGMFRGLLRIYGSLYYLAMGIFAIQAITGLAVYKKYKRLIKQSAQ